MIHSAYNWFGFFAIVVAATIGATVLGSRRSTIWPQRLLLAAVGLRILGSMARYEVLWRFYRGAGDAVRYYSEGLIHADSIRSLASHPFTLDYWATQGRWWGTNILVKLSGAILTVTGPTMRGEFLIFSLISLLGLLAIGAALRAVQPGREAESYSLWLLLWPSLWFWPSSVGKEAILILAIGLFTLGYAGKSQSVSWLPLAAGLGLAFIIRPHVAAVLVMAATVAHWLGTWERVTLTRILEAIGAAVIAFFVLQGMAQQFGLERLDAEGVQEFVESSAAQTLQGGSNIGAVPLSAGAPLLAFVNIWMRPFIWEAHNATSLFAAIELMVFWWLAWRRRKAIRLSLKYWRKHRLLRFTLPFLLAYTLMIGLTFGNLGIIARQRAPIFPFMFMIVLAARDPAQIASERSRVPANRAHQASAQGAAGS